MVLKTRHLQYYIPSPNKTTKFVSLKFNSNLHNRIISNSSSLSDLKSLNQKLKRLILNNRIVYVTMLEQDQTNPVAKTKMIQRVR